MKRNLVYFFLFSIFMSCTTPNEKPKAIQWPTATPPIAAINPHQRIIHGDTVVDNYYWMIDYFKKGPDSTKVVDYLKAENAYLNTMMQGSAKFQTALVKEMKGRIKEKDNSVPVFDNGYFYYSRTEEGEQYFKYCRKKGSLAAKEEVLLDADELAKGHAYYSVNGFSVSPNNKLMAYGVDVVSRRQYTIYIKNLETGAVYADAVANTEGDAVWANDNKTIFYTEKNPVTLLSEQIKKHVLGTDSKKDEVVYREKDNTNYIGVGKSKNGAYIFISSAATLSNELRMIDANNPESAFRVFAPRSKDVLYDVAVVDDKFLIRTNWKAKNFRLMECPLASTQNESWKEVIPNRNDVLLESIEEFKAHVILSERKNGLPELRVLAKNGADFYLKFNEPAYDVYVGANPTYNTTTLRYGYTSLTTPSTTYDYDLLKQTQQLMKRTEVVGGYDPKMYVTERLFATAEDGTKIPIALVYKKDIKKDGNTPVLLYGYGSYGANMDVSFSSQRLSLLDRGFIFAIANIRGGQEMGRQWYEDGKLMKKKNTFTDFIACGKHLIAEKYTSKEHLYAHGGSAGGLLMGAVINLAPDLWHGVIADVPFVDVINTMLDESIPLTTNEFDEWGNPKQKAAYDYMKSYAPYENITKKAYPNLLVTTGLHDSQVQYFEPAKWVAKLRAMKTDKNLLLLKTNMEFGHGGASGRFDYLNDQALKYAFLLALEGIEN
jgi:oligopeptidase B